MTLNWEERSRTLFFLIFIFILCLWLAVEGPTLMACILVKKNSKPEAGNVDQKEEDTGKDRHLSLSKVIAHR